MLFVWSFSGAPKILWKRFLWIFNKFIIIKEKNSKLLEDILKFSLSCETHTLRSRDNEGDTSKLTASLCLFLQDYQWKRFLKLRVGWVLKTVSSCPKSSSENGWPIQRLRKGYSIAPLAPSCISARSVSTLVVFLIVGSDRFACTWLSFSIPFQTPFPGKKLLLVCLFFETGFFWVALAPLELAL